MQSMFAPVTVYSKPGCAPCARIKAALNEAGIEFDDVDVTTNDEALSYVTDVLGVSSVPVVVDDRGPIIGYDTSKLRELIEYHTASETGL